MNTINGIYNDTKEFYHSINPNLVAKCAVTAPISALFFSIIISGPVGWGIGAAIPIVFYATTKCDRVWFDFSDLKNNLKESLKIHARAGLIAIAVNVTVVVITALLGLHSPGQVDHKNIISEMMKKGLLWVIYAEFVVIAPLMEEILFRGFIMDMIYEAQKRFSDETGNSKFQKMTRVALQGIVFGAAHFRPSQGWGNISIICSISVLGMGFGYMREKTDNITSSFFFHALNNFIATTLVVLSSR